MSVIKMTDLELAGKRVFIRADLNVPVKEGKVTLLKVINDGVGEVSDLGI